MHECVLTCVCECVGPREGVLPLPNPTLGLSPEEVGALLTPGTWGWGALPRASTVSEPLVPPPLWTAATAPLWPPTATTAAAPPGSGDQLPQPLLPTAAHQGSEGLARVSPDGHPQPPPPAPPQRTWQTCLGGHG